MFFTEEKLKARITELEPYRYLNRTKIENWKVKEDVGKEDQYPPTVDETWADFPIGSRWEGRDYYLWVSTTLQAPAFDEEEDFVLLFYFGMTGGGHNSGFESLLFVNGEPYQGVDSNHPEVFLGHQYSGQEITLAIRLWSGLEGGGPQQMMCHQFLVGDCAILSPEVDNFYYTTQVMLDTIMILNKNDPERFALLNLLEKAYEKIDWSSPGREGFYSSVLAANDFLSEEVRELPKNSPVTVTAVGHTHIDVAWLWRLKHTREKCARSFSTVLRLMERYPEYFFLQSQPQLYAYIKEDYPEIYEKIKERIDQGNWEVDGAMWVEADCNISSGESLVRQILHGSKFVEEEFDRDVKYLWLPDVFGYSWALPQILKKSGIETFMTTKISWNQYNRMPHDTFIWRGIDGSEILTHFITTPDRHIIDENIVSAYTYNGLLEPYSVKGIYDSYRNKDFNSEMLLSYGYGDGGGGVNREMLEKRRRLDLMPGLPRVQTGRAREYFERLHKTVEGTGNYVHTWDGELYLEYHRGTYTSQAYIKKWNRKLELGFRELEMLHTFASITKEDWEYPAQQIHKGWEIILRNQFHDIIPGSSIKEVYEDYTIECQEAKDTLQEITNDFEVNYLKQEENKWSVFNNAGWVASELVFVPITEDGYFVDEEGEDLTSEKVSGGYKVEILDVSPLSNRVITFVPAGDSSLLASSVEEKPLLASPVEEKQKSAFKFNEEKDGVETPFYCIKWNQEGQLTSIVDLKNEREVLKEGGCGNVLRLYEDKPMEYDAWDIDLYYILKSKTLEASKIEVLCENALWASIGFTYEFGTSSITQEMTLYCNTPRIDFKTRVNWQERQQLLRTSFEVDIRSTEATYQIQYGNVKRPTHWNTSWDMARFESVAHQWVDFSEGNYGVALLNDCKYGHSVKDQTISLSLLKGAIYPDPDADRGEHEFTYSLYPHKGNFVAGKVTEQAWSLNSPMLVSKGAGEEGCLFKLDKNDSLAIDAIKRQEGGKGIILRFHEHTGSKRKITLEPQFAFESWQETNLMEKVIGEKVVGVDGKIQLELTPYEIKTILIEQSS